MKRFDFDQRQKQSLMIKVGLTAFLTASLITNIILATQSSDRTTILLPSEVSGKYTISTKVFDERYLADASTTISYLFLSLTPATVDYRTQELLRWVHPAATQKIAAGLEEEAIRIKSQRLTSSFSIKEAGVKNLRDVEVTGSLSRFIADKLISQDDVVVKMQWHRDSRGMALIKSLNWEVLKK